MFGQHVALWVVSLGRSTRDRKLGRCGVQRQGKGQGNRGLTCHLSAGTVR
jgi:hypothetical protein